MPKITTVNSEFSLWRIKDANGARLCSDQEAGSFECRVLMARALLEESGLWRGVAQGCPPVGGKTRGLESRSACLEGASQWGDLLLSSISPVSPKHFIRWTAPRITQRVRQAFKNRGLQVPRSAAEIPSPGEVRRLTLALGRIVTEPRSKHSSAPYSPMIFTFSHGTLYVKDYISLSPDLGTQGSYIFAINLGKRKVSSLPHHFV